MSNESVIIDIPGSALTGDWPTYEKDAVIVAGKTIYCFDFQDTNCWPSQGNASSGSSILNLVTGGDPGTTGSATLTYSGGGFSLTTAGSQRVILPAAAKIGTAVDEFLACLWFKAGTQTLTGTQFFGWHYGNSGPFGLRTPTGNTHQFLADGKTYSQSLSAASGRHQVVLGRVKVSGSYFAKVWIDNVEVSSTSTGATTVQPSTPPANAVIGDASDMNETNGSGYVGTIYRSWLMDCTGWTGDKAALIDMDWQLNKDRIS